ncbi:MAG: hypothetical protein VR67_16955 [Peptococcaceae bacterium BRH_c8a]|nr:MAG: hypothetical protein VR67_16955 [Peptococcaceae bacterium BRH_c8a]
MFSLLSLHKSGANGVKSMMPGKIVLALILLIISVLVTACEKSENTSASSTESENISTFSLNQLQPKVLPYVFTNQGTWVVKPVQIKNKDKAKALENMQHTLDTISPRLKPFPAYRNGKPIIPKIKITPITIVKQGRSVNTLAWFDIEYNAIVLTWDIASVGEETIQYGFSHELGHWVWYYILTDQDKTEYRALVNGKKTMEYHNDLKDPGMNKDLLIEEWFAEDFRIYACEVPDYPHLLRTPIQKSPGKPDDLKKFFKRVKADEA